MGLLRESRETVEVARPAHRGCATSIISAVEKCPSQVSHLQRESCETFPGAHVFYGFAFSIPGLIDFTSEILYFAAISRLI